MSSRIYLTSFNLLTLGIVQASLALLSLNRKFQVRSAEKNKNGLRWNTNKDLLTDAETSYSSLLIENIFYFFMRYGKHDIKSVSKFQHGVRRYPPIQKSVKISEF